MIPFVREMAFRYGEVDQVSPLIRRVVAHNPGPFTFHGTGTYILGRGEAAVIDPGPADEAHLEALLRALDGERVSAILITHSHADHSPLAGPLAERTGATIYGLADPATGSAEEEAHGDFRPHVSVADGEIIAGPGWTVEALHTPGHASNHVCYALKEEHALFSGDHIMGWSTTVVSPPDGDMGAYYASLDKVAARDFATLWPTHGPPVTAPAPFIAAYRAHRHERERQILAAIASGQDTIAAMVPVIYAAVDPRLHPAAARSVLAHLIHLSATGVVAAEPEPSLTAHYRILG
ncbi:MAG: MBL fold metallo-hydrolase [Pseudomonadota bacterium]|jgi:glyoxylase-like metal-dependent hydrolase (beta-lactamase superfamily II)